MEMYKRADFEKQLRKNKNRIVIRNGSFVGLYRYDFNLKILYLTKPIINDYGGKKDAFYVESEGEYWGSGGFSGINTLFKCNESHFIPFGYTLSLKSHLLILDSCLGGNYIKVEEKVKIRNPNSVTTEFDFFNYL